MLTISAALHASFTRVRARVSDQAPQQLRELCVKVCIMVVERVREAVECSMPEEVGAAVEGEQDRKRVGVVKESLWSVTREG